MGWSFAGDFWVGDLLLIPYQVYCLLLKKELRHDGLVFRSEELLSGIF